jgi:amidohydrolase
VTGADLTGTHLADPGLTGTGVGVGTGLTGTGLTGTGLTGTGLTGTGLADVAERLNARLDSELADAVALRHELHADAELSGSEYRTAARVAAALGGGDAPPVAGTGRIVRIGAADRPCVAIRAELDALPVTEQTGVPWTSRTGAMHACGHDVHLAALVALGRAARAADLAGELPSALLAVLQPREETVPSGAFDIIASGALDAQQPAAIIAVHLQHQLAAGTVAAGVGTVNASSDEFEIAVQGTGGHAGYPHLAADPVPALCACVLALQQIVSRRTDPTHAAVVSVGTLAAGQAPNVIPPSAVARGTLRTLDQADRPGLHKALREIVEHTCQAYGCRGVVTIHDGEPALVNDEVLTTASWPWLRAAGLRIDTSFRSCGADDFSYYSATAPTLMLFLGTGGPVSLHHPAFLPDDDMVGQVARAMLAGYLGAQRLLSASAETQASLLRSGGLPSVLLPLYTLIYFLSNEISRTWTCALLRTILPAGRATNIDPIVGESGVQPHSARLVIEVNKVALHRPDNFVAAVTEQHDRLLAKVSLGWPDEALCPRRAFSDPVRPVTGLRIEGRLGVHQPFVLEDPGPVRRRGQREQRDLGDQRHCGQPPVVDSFPLQGAGSAADKRHAAQQRLGACSGLLKRGVQEWV